jgi:hypothetical protein
VAGRDRTRMACRLTAATVATLIGLGHACPAARPELRILLSPEDNEFYALSEDKLNGHQGYVIKSREAISLLPRTLPLIAVLHLISYWIAKDC